MGADGRLERPSVMWVSVTPTNTLNRSVNEFDDRFISTIAARHSLAIFESD